MRRLAPLAVLILAGCGHGPSPTARDAARVCGTGNVSRVDQNTHTFACRAPAAAQACRTVDAVVLVHLDPHRWPDIAAHVKTATDAGQPRHLHLDRPDADAHRQAALAGHPTKKGQDRDEYPNAFSAEGGAGADVAYVPSAENRSQGAAMGNALAPYCDGQAYELVSP